jgi:hypothetical protein
MKNKELEEKEDNYPKWQIIVAFIFGVTFCVVMLVIAIFFPDPTNFQILVFRVILSLSAAGIAALIPGFINVNISPYIKAGGAIAVFIIVYWFNPPMLVVNGNPEHEGYLGTLKNHFNQHPTENFTLVLSDKILEDFWLDGIYSGENWTEVLKKICMDTRNSCIICEPPAEEFTDGVIIRLKDGIDDLVNLSSKGRPKYTCK